VFLNCTVSGDARLKAKSVHLGRPWHPGGSTAVKSHAAYLYCLGPHIATAGWTSMSGVQPATERFFEYQNSGAGAAVNSSRPQLSAYFLSNFVKIAVNAIGKGGGKIVQAGGQTANTAGLQKALVAARQSKQSYEQLAQEASVSATKQIFQDMASDMQRHIDQLDYRMQTVAQADQFDQSN
jgi:hypothetical protein